MNGLAMLGIWAAVATGIGVIAGWSPLAVWLESHDKLAAWVQAVGSIAAIGATGWAVRHAHNLQERERAKAERHEYTRLLESVYQLVGGLHQVARKIHDYIETLPESRISAESVRMMLAEVTALASALDRVDVTRLHRFEFVQAVLVANTVAPRFQKGLAQAVAPGWVSIDGMTDGTEIRAHALETADTVKPFGKILLDAVKTRGGVPRDDNFASF